MLNVFPSPTKKAALDMLNVSLSPTKKLPRIYWMYPPPHKKAALDMLNVSASPPKKLPWICWMYPPSPQKSCPGYIECIPLPHTKRYSGYAECIPPPQKSALDMLNVSLPDKKRCLGYDTKLHLIARILFWRASSTPLLSLLQGPLWPGVVVPISVLFISQTDLFENCFFSIELCAKKPSWLTTA